LSPGEILMPEPQRLQAPWLLLRLGHIEVTQNERLAE
jgi:hypothetical protein